MGRAWPSFSLPDTNLGAPVSITDGPAHRENP